MEKIENLETFINLNGYPILRRCKNCIFWNDDTELGEKYKAGYCKFKPFYFAFTLEPSVFAITKEFYVCENHKLQDEERLKQVCDVVKLKDVLKKKEEL